jgi:hypothetical protein
MIIRSLTALGCLTLAFAPDAARAAEPAAIDLQGKGVQIYTCDPAGSGFAWHFKAPEATLYDAAGHPDGHHFAGPTWQAPDGSSVVGDVGASSAAPRAGTIPWMVLRIKSQTGAGIFAAVRYVTRTKTEGGAMPATGCDAAHAGAEARVPYTAEYILFPALAAP